MNTPPSFEWDDAKATANFIKHGVSFDAGSRVFLDDNRLDIEDTRFNYGEERRNVTGVVDGVCLTITYTLLPSGTARIISARPASRKERGTYGYRS